MNEQKSAKGVARLLVRGLSSCFEREEAEAKLTELIGLFGELSVCRHLDWISEGNRLADRDSSWLEELIGFLEDEQKS